MFNIQRILFNQLIRNYSTNPSPKETSNNATTNAFNGKERSLNHVQIIGRVGQDPKVGSFTDKEEHTADEQQSEKQQKKVVLFSLATNEYQGLDEKGEPKTRVDWHRVAVFAPRLQENVEKYVRQGDRIHITGRLHYNLIKDKSGLQRTIPSIVADDVIFLTKLN